MSPVKEVEMEFHRPRFHKCPMCHVKGLERLQTYSHCVNCLHFILEEDFK